MNILDSTIEQDVCKENQLVIDNFTTEVVWIENSWSTFRISDLHNQSHVVKLVTICECWCPTLM